MLLGTLINECVRPKNAFVARRKGRRVCRIRRIEAEEKDSISAHVFGFLYEPCNSLSLVTKSAIECEQRDQLMCFRDRLALLEHVNILAPRRTPNRIKSRHSHPVRTVFSGLLITPFLVFHSLYRFGGILRFLCRRVGGVGQG